MTSKKGIGYIVKIALLGLAIWALAPYFYATVSRDVVVKETMEDLIMEMDKVYVAQGTLPGVPLLPIQKIGVVPLLNEPIQVEPTSLAIVPADPVVVKRLPNVAATAVTPAALDPVIVASGQFEGKTFHKGSGTVEVVKMGDHYAVRFENDFSVTNGPDLFVYFGNNNNVDTSARLGKLKGSSGSQNYIIPGNIDPTQFSEVWIRCRAFSVNFAKAALQ